MKIIHLPAPPIAEALEKVGGIPEDIRTLRRAGITQAELQRVCGPDRISFYRYERGVQQPKELVVGFLLSLWAERVRQQSQS